MSFAFVGLILIVPFFIFRGRSSSEFQRIAAVWIVGGVVGAYVVGIFVLAAGIVALLASAFRSGPRGPEGATLTGPRISVEWHDVAHNQAM